MNIFDAISTGFTELVSHKMRSMLTMLGVIFGVAAVIAMVSIGEGAKQEALQQIKEMGTDVIYIKRAVIAGELLEKAQQKSPNGLVFADVDGLRNTLDFAKRIIAVREVFADVKQGEKSVPVKVVGIEPGYDQVTRIKVQYGRFINQKDVDDGRKVCVLGIDAKRQLFGFQDAIGKQVRIGDNIFRVVGTLDYKEIGASQAFSAMRMINSDMYIPISLSATDFQIYSQQPIPVSMTSMREMIFKLRNALSLPKSPITDIIVQTVNEEATTPTSELIQSILDRRHKGIIDYEVIIPAQLLRQSQQTQRIFNIVMAAIASISLLVGGIGIMNIMLATVSQRTREIGIRRCIGATRGDIIRQFMLESLVITCLGGIIGVGAGVLTASVISKLAGWLTMVSVQAIIVSFGVSVLVGVVFGMYPAIRAAMVDPIEALRTG